MSRAKYPGLVARVWPDTPNCYQRKMRHECFAFRVPGGSPRVKRFDPKEILIVTPLDWWRALPANVADGYAEKVVAAVELLFPQTRVTHAPMGAPTVYVDFPGGHRGGWREEESTDYEEVERVLTELAQDVWERETG